jgi:hypothetical protein
MEMRDSHPDHSGTLEEYRRDRDRKQQLERVRVVKYVARSGCVEHKAEHDIPQHQPTIYTTRAGGFSKEELDLWHRASASHPLPAFLFRIQRALWKLGTMCLFAPNIFCLYGMQQNSRQRRLAMQS